ncbi:MAG: glutathione S-transferase family protein [Alphaproteobacteria bacterium]
MALTLYYHPLSSFCWKALIGLYETGVPFTPRLVNLGDPEDAAAFRKVWPLGKFPVLTEGERTVPESTTIIEYLAQYYPGPSKLLPSDPDLARQTRLHDRFFDLYVHIPMQKIVGDVLRPEGGKDPFGVEKARADLEIAYGMIDQDVAGKTWIMGDTFTLADCAALPALYYADRVVPLDGHAPTAAYLQRLILRPSVARVLAEAEPYFHMFPIKSEKVRA